MSAQKYIKLFIASRNEIGSGRCEEVAGEVSQLVSGSFAYALYEHAEQAGIETDSITQHLEELYDSANHFGLIYFIIFFADAVEFTLPKEFIAMSLKNDLAPMLSAAIIEDWLDAAE